MARIAGFSLLETVIATALLATAVVGLAELFAITTRGTLRSRDTTSATVRASQKLEELIAIDDPAPGADAVDGGYVRRWSVRPLPGDPGMLVLQVVVTRQRLAEARLITIRPRRLP
jgi:Tfp pilus assembly protein PilV